MNYWLEPGIPKFNGESIEVSEIDYGYEDDDLLTFSPPVLTLGFSDPDGINYLALKSAFNKSPDIVNNLPDPFGYSFFHSVTLSINSSVIFYGFIDKQSLQYVQNNTSESNYITFDVLDASTDLKNINLSGGASDYAGGIIEIYNIIKNVFKNFQYNVTNNLNTFESPDFNGIYLKHDWTFDNFGEIGQVIFSRSWNINADSNGYDKIQWYREWLMKGSSNLAIYLKNIANEFAMSIGISSYNKVYIIKRFSIPTDSEITNLNNIITSDFNRSIHLSNIIGTRVNINKNGNIYSAIGGDFPTVSGGINDTAKYPTLTREITGFNTERVTDVNSGSATFRIIKHDNTVHSVLNGVIDPVLAQRDLAHWLNAKWLYLSQSKCKDLIECSAPGINFFMHRYYSYNFAGIVSTFRPIRITKDYINNLTNLTLLEV